MKIILTESQLKNVIKSETSDKFNEFSKKRMEGATKIADNAKEKGDTSMLTYHHFVVKLPYYKKAYNGKFNLSDAKKEFNETLKKISFDMGQTEFQKEMGRLEVLGELIIKHN